MPVSLGGGVSTDNLVSVSSTGVPTANGQTLKVPYILAQSNVPIILCSSGNFNATGQLTLTTALPYTPTGTVLVYIFAGNGLTAGLYSATFSSTTVCQLVGNPTTTSGAYAGGTTEATLATVTILGGSLGNNGKIRDTTLIQIPNNANNKILNERLNAQELGSFTFTTSSYARSIMETVNQGNPAVNLSTFFTNIGGGSANFRRLTVDTTQNQTLTLAGTLAVATDYIILESYSIEILAN